MSASAASVVCMRHPKYSGVESPDLSCKVCCSKFVERIRSEQSKLFELKEPISKNSMDSAFSPMKFNSTSESTSKRRANFDGGWI